MVALIVGGHAYMDRTLGIVEYYIKGKQYLKTEEYCLACGMSKHDTMMWILKYGHVLPFLVKDL